MKTKTKPTKRVCEYCGKKLPVQRGPGRKKKYCNEKHKMLAWVERKY